MKKLDLKKELKEFYLPSPKKVVIIDVPAFNFAMIDGEIEAGCSPGTSPSFQQAMEALYGIAYTLKFMSKQRQEAPIDYTVVGLEALWWVEDGEFEISRPDNWKWRAMILQPEHVTPEMFHQGQDQLRKKRDRQAVDKLRLERFQEGLCVQTMHIGPYAAEPATVERMRIFAGENGYKMEGRHHEIYLGDPRRSAPEKLKTVLRHPIARA